MAWSGGPFAAGPGRQCLILLGGEQSEYFCIAILISDLHPFFMRQHSLRRPDTTEYCSVEFDAANNWLLVTWKGFVTAQDGERGAEETLRMLELTHVHYLLNDNSLVTGPWFDSVEWLERVWAPQAERLGLRCVAHVMQSDANAELAAAADHDPFAGRFDLQIFSALPEARQWLLECQDAHAA